MRNVPGGSRESARALVGTFAVGTFAAGASITTLYSGFPADQPMALFAANFI